MWLGRAGFWAARTEKKQFEAVLGATVSISAVRSPREPGCVTPRCMASGFRNYRRRKETSWRFRRRHLFIWDCFSF